MKKIYFLLIACCIGFAASAQIIYQPSGTASFTGAGTYCVGSAISPLTFNYTTCSSGTGSVTGASCQINWYYNTTNTNAYIPGSTVLVSGPIPTSCATTPTGTASLTPSLSTGGNYYFFCAISWTGGTVACGGITDTIYSPTQLVTVSPPPIMPAGSLSICIGSTITLTNAFTGGTWSSFNPGVVSVHPTTGVATGLTVGASFITYTLGACNVASYIYSSDTPTVISPTTVPSICVGSNITLSTAATGGSWSSSSSSLASVGTSGVVFAFNPGLVTISYTYPSSGCYTRRQVNIVSNPAAITGSTNICVGGTSALASSPTGGTWSSSTSAASIGSSSGIATGVSGGTSIISYILPASLSSCYITTTVSVSPPPTAISGPSSVCAGSSITLANTIGGGAWSSSNTAVATVPGTIGTVTGVSTGPVNITYTIPGCTAVWKTLTVNPLPGTIMGVFSTCYNDSTLLTSTAPGGTWSSSNATIATVGTSSGYVTGHSLGVATIMYTVGSCFSSATVTVNPLAPILGSDSVCVGSQVALTDIVGGGTWASSNPAVGSIDPTTGIITGLVTGITFIGYTLPTGCATIMLMTVNPALPVIAGPISICNGSAVTLSNGVTGGRWKTNNQYVAQIDSVTGAVQGHFPDTTTISYTIFGCVATTQMTVNALPVPDIAYVSSTNKLSTPAIHIAYQWYDSTVAANPIAGATNNTFLLPPGPGKYAVMATDINGCSGLSRWYRTAVGVDNITAESFRVFPNPAVSTVYIDAPVSVKAVVSSTDGKSLLTVENAKEISIADLATGMYFISLYDDAGQLVAVKKLIKQ